MPRLAAPIAVLVLLAALAAGCGSGGSSTGSSLSTVTPAGKPPSAQENGAPVGSQVRRCDTRAVDAELLRATGVPCGAARQALFGWQRAVGRCAPDGGASRGACSIAGGYRCQAVATGKGVDVSCAAPGRAVAFRAQAAG
jgi:hypothetical protein